MMAAKLLLPLLFLLACQGVRSFVIEPIHNVFLPVRHGFLLAAVNMPTGERWAYATFLLHVLIHEHKLLPYVVMYDINCR